MCVGKVEDIVTGKFIALCLHCYKPDASSAVQYKNIPVTIISLTLTVQPKKDLSVRLLVKLVLVSFNVSRKTNGRCIEQFLLNREN